MNTYPLYLGNTPVQMSDAQPGGGYVELLGETYYRIAHYDKMPPFFMSIVSGADHWLFISSSGGLTAGRTNADSALFPYETEDKITAHHELAGGRTMLRVGRDKRTHLWRPFTTQYAAPYATERHLYKNIPGNKLVFEEINRDLELTLRVAWRTGDRFGFIRTVWLENFGDRPCQIDLLDGLQNILPYGATSSLQTTMSSLLHAYKRSELDAESGLGIFALSATLSDRAEPSESLMATVAWQVGLDNPRHLLSTEQVAAFGNGRSLTPEQDICGKAGAYLVNSAFTLEPGEGRHWHIVADVNQDSAAVTRLACLLGQDRAIIEQQIEEDIAGNMTRWCVTSPPPTVCSRPPSRPPPPTISPTSCSTSCAAAFSPTATRSSSAICATLCGRATAPCCKSRPTGFSSCPTACSISDLYARAEASGSPDLIRLCHEYLPLTFSRRHGDPSRPWNWFSINLKQADGSPRLDYQGNWRDIFQNWEPLMLAFPGYIDGVIAKFLNATTADGYNPYRVTRDGIEWETPEPHNPWSNIGYWSDHQIIYLQKLLELAEQTDPGAFARLSQRPIFAAANVPYRLKPYAEMLADWSNTIEFDWEAERAIATAVAQFGTDARLHRDAIRPGHSRQPDRKIAHPAAGEIDQSRPRRRYLDEHAAAGMERRQQRPGGQGDFRGHGRLPAPLHCLLAGAVGRGRRISVYGERGRRRPLCPCKPSSPPINPICTAGFGDGERRAIMDELGAAATAYRAAIYANGLPAAQSDIPAQQLQDFLDLAQSYVEQTLRANRREDGLYHAYNILRLGDGHGGY
jgi:hypothetical protein